MPTFKDLKAEGHGPLQVLNYGAPGTGKTVLAHSFPRPRTIDLDNGVRSVVNAVASGIISEPVDWQYETILETDFSAHGRVKKATAFDKACKTLDAWLLEPEEWDTLIVDSLSSLNQFAINKAIENMAALGMSKSLQQSQKVDMQITKMQDYGGAMTLFNHFMDWIRSLDKNIVCIAHEYEQLNDSGSVRRIQPLLIGQLRQRIVKDFDEVWYSKTQGIRDNISYITQTASDNTVVAKSRLGCFDAQEEFLTYDRILAKMEGDGA